MPLKTLRENELSESVSPLVYEHLRLKKETISFAIVDPDGGVIQKKVGVPDEKTVEMWNNVVLAVSRKMFEELHGKGCVLRKYNSRIKNLSYEIWTDDTGEKINPYIGKLLSSGVRVYGYAVVFRRTDFDQLKTGASLYRSVSQKQLSKFFNDSTSEKKRKNELALLKRRSNNFNDPLVHVHDQSVFPIHQMSAHRRKSSLRSKRNPRHQKQERTKRSKQAESTANNNMPVGNNDNFSYRTFDSSKFEKRIKKSSHTSKNDDKSSVFTKGDKKSLTSDVVSDGAFLLRKKNKFVEIQTRETNPSGRRRSTRIRKKMSQK